MGWGCDSLIASSSLLSELIVMWSSMSPFFYIVFNWIRSLMHLSTSKFLGFSLNCELVSADRCLSISASSILSSFNKGYQWWFSWLLTALQETCSTSSWFHLVSSSVVDTLKCFHPGSECIVGTLDLLSSGMVSWTPALLMSNLIRIDLHRWFLVPFLAIELHAVVIVGSDPVWKRRACP